MKHWLAIAGVILLAAALVFFNQGVKKSAAPDHDEDENAPASQAQTSSPAPGVPSPDAGAALVPEETIGDPASAKHHIQVGWIYDDKNQQKPETLTVPLQAIRDFATHTPGSVSAVIVNLDIPQEDRSPAAQAVAYLGIQVDGTPVFSGNLSDIPKPKEAITSQLDAAINKK